MSGVGDRVRTSRSGAPSDLRGQIEAKLLLNTLLPQVRARMKDDAWAWKTRTASPLMKGLQPFMRSDNLGGVHVYQTVDGWYADLVFKEVPPGVPKAIGNPSSEPLKSRAAAVETATLLLLLILTAETDGPQPDSGGRQFDLDGLYVEMPADVLAKVSTIAADVGIERDRAEIRLRHILDEDFRDEPTEAGWAALSRDRQALYLGLMAFLLTEGIFRLLRKEPTMRVATERTAP